MGCCVAYECDKCGGLVVVGPKEIVDRYGGEHVCDPKVLAERRFMADPFAPFPPELK